MQFRVCAFFFLHPFACSFAGTWNTWKAFFLYLASYTYECGAQILPIYSLDLDRSQQCAIDEVKHNVFEVMKKDCELSRHDMCVSE